MDVQQRYLSRLIIDDHPLYYLPVGFLKLRFFLLHCFTFVRLLNLVWILNPRHFLQPQQKLPDLLLVDSQIGVKIGNIEKFKKKR